MSRWRLRPGGRAARAPDRRSPLNPPVRNRAPGGYSENIGPPRSTARGHFLSIGRRLDDLGLATAVNNIGDAPYEQDNRG